MSPAICYKTLRCGREDLQVPIGILLHEWLRKIAVFGRFRTIEEVLGFAKALPAAPSPVGPHLPDVPQSLIASHYEQFLASVLITAQGDAIRATDPNRRLTQLLPGVPCAVRRRLPDLPDVAVTCDGEDFLSTILIAANSEVAA